MRTLAVAASVPQAVGTRWFREAGNMPTSDIWSIGEAYSGRYLSLAEREELAILHARGAGSHEDRPADGALGIDDLAGAATQCRDAQPEAWLSCNWRSGSMPTGRPSARNP